MYSHNTHFCIAQSCIIQNPQKNVPANICHFKVESVIRQPTILWYDFGGEWISIELCILLALNLLLIFEK